MEKKYRKEHDSLGEVDVPLEAYYGSQTKRAVDNFPISKIRPHSEFLKATAMVKMGAARVNMNLGKLEVKKGEAIVRAADEIIHGKLYDHFVVDVFQAGAGTSHNMNTNEVIANRAIELLKGNRGDYTLVHPNDHVNMSQSTNDVFPTSMRIASLMLLKKLYPLLDNLINSLKKKSKGFNNVIKAGRTHLQDAVPIRLGQEFNAYSITLKKCSSKIKRESQALKKLGIGGTAIGTGINTHKNFRREVIETLSDITSIELCESENMVESTQSMADFVALSSSLKIMACELIRIANDLRLMSSGPTTGFGEIRLPPVQPGSSIMPGKVNPVMAEVMNMVCYQVIGHDLTISMAAQAGQMELNVMMPVINFNLLMSIEIFKNVIDVFNIKCIKGIVANVQRCKDYVDKTVGLATVLNPHIGYERAAEVAKEATEKGMSIKDIVIKKKILSKEQIDKMFDPFNMT